MIELKPCPFCGGQASLQDWTRGHKPGELALDDTWGVACENKGCPCNPATDDGYRSPEAAAEAWNRRAAV